MSKIDLSKGDCIRNKTFNCRPFYDCNIPPKVDGYACIELSDDIYKYEKMVKITRVEIVGRNGREFSKILNDSFYEVSMQDDGKTIKLFEKTQQ